MEKEFIPYEQALVLKQLGFDSYLWKYREFYTMSKTKKIK
jgi:hypothetical protein